VNKKALLAAVLVAVFIGFAISTSAQETTNLDLQALSSKFFDHMAKSEFDSASKLFHYPPGYTPAERLYDIDVVANMLNIFTNEFGTPSSQRLSEAAAMFYHVTAQSAHAEYWLKNPDSIQVDYEVDFSRESKGYVFVQFCNISDKWEIRSVAYGLPAERIDAKERVQEIIDKVLREMQPLMPAPSEDKPRAI
jgi:hypothetical protein